MSYSQLSKVLSELLNVRLDGVARKKYEVLSGVAAASLKEDENDIKRIMVLLDRASNKQGDLEKLYKESVLFGVQQIKFKAELRKADKTAEAVRLRLPTAAPKIPIKVRPKEQKPTEPKPTEPKPTKPKPTKPKPKPKPTEAAAPRKRIRRPKKQKTEKRKKLKTDETSSKLSKETVSPSSSSSSEEQAF
jgi:hypothetical protein